MLILFAFLAGASAPPNLSVAVEPRGACLESGCDFLATVSTATGARDVKVTGYAGPSAGPGKNWERGGYDEVGLGDLAAGAVVKVALHFQGGFCRQGGTSRPGYLGVRVKGKNRAKANADMVMTIEPDPRSLLPGACGGADPNLLLAEVDAHEVIAGGDVGIHATATNSSGREHGGPVWLRGILRTSTGQVVTETCPDIRETRFLAVTDFECRLHVPLDAAPGPATLILNLGTNYDAVHDNNTSVPMEIDILPPSPPKAVPTLALDSTVPPTFATGHPAVVKVTARNGGPGVLSAHVEVKALPSQEVLVTSGFNSVSFLEPITKNLDVLPPDGTTSLSVTGICESGCTSGLPTTNEASIFQDDPMPLEAEDDLQDDQGSFYLCSTNTDNTQVRACSPLDHEAALATLSIASAGTMALQPLEAMSVAVPAGVLAGGAIGAGLGGVGWVGWYLGSTVILLAEATKAEEAIQTVVQEGEDVLPRRFDLPCQGVDRTRLPTDFDAICGGSVLSAARLLIQRRVDALNSRCNYEVKIGRQDLSRRLRSEMCRDACLKIKDGKAVKWLFGNSSANPATPSGPLLLALEALNIAVGYVTFIEAGKLSPTAPLPLDCN